MKRQQSPDCITNERLEILVLQHKTSTQFQQSRQTKGQRMTGRACTNQLKSAGAAKKQEKTVIKKGTSISEVT